MTTETRNIDNIVLQRVTNTVTTERIYIGNGEHAVDIQYENGKLERIFLSELPKAGDYATMYLNENSLSELIKLLELAEVDLSKPRPVPEEE